MMVGPTNDMPRCLRSLLILVDSVLSVGTSLGEKRLRCTGSTIYEAYHDDEWGVPRHDDRHLFELLILEGTQAGLSWETILKRRKAYRLAFDNFSIQIVASYGEKETTNLLENKGIIRNKLKIHAAINNAKVVLRIQKEFGSLDKHLWGFVDGAPLQRNRFSPSDVPTESTESTRMSKDLKQRGMSFVGPTIMYAFMQSTGMVNDHYTSCFRLNEVKKLSEN
jgi:DNA-3-methyladenine glycosylase I